MGNKFSILVFCLLAALLAGCSRKQTVKFNDLNTIKKEFVNKILSESSIDEGPFLMNYSLRTILASDNVVSLFGEVFVYDHLPHGWLRYETKTFIKNNSNFKEIKLKDLFAKTTQMEFLRNYCEEHLKKSNDCNYFQYPNPLRDHLDEEFLKLFVVDHESLILIFQPYAVGGFADGPFIVKIPFTDLVGKWQKGNPLEKYLPISNFISSWDPQNWIYR